MWTDFRCGRLSICLEFLNFLCCEGRVLLKEVLGINLICVVIYADNFVYFLRGNCISSQSTVYYVISIGDITVVEFIQWNNLESAYSFEQTFSNL